MTSLDTDVVIAIDPGREKCGVAVVAAKRGVLFRAVVDSKKLTELVGRLNSAYHPVRILMGNGTGHNPLAQEMALILKNRQEADENSLLLVDEYGTTEDARRLYWRENPPRGWRRLIPLGLQTPPEPVDGYVAWILAERYLHGEGLENKKNKKNKKNT
jgi:RNase H-fold protein (predicted Holliday junction resolvase)